MAFFSRLRRGESHPALEESYGSCAHRRGCAGVVYTNSASALFCITGIGLDGKSKTEWDTSM